MTAHMFEVRYMFDCLIDIKSIFKLHAVKRRGHQLICIKRSTPVLFRLLKNKSKLYKYVRNTLVL